MRTLFTSFLVILPVLGACGASMPPPTQRLADAESATRSARELGAHSVPAAALSLKLAQDQIAMAKKAMSEEENEKANSLLIRAKADAELAIAQSRERTANVEERDAVDDARKQRDTNELQGAVK